jgi:isatin hydrolase
VQDWEAKHGPINAGEWVVLRSDWDKRAHDENLFLNADETGPHTPGPTAEVISICWTRDRRLGQPVHRHRCRAGGRHDPALPGAQPAARQQPLWSGVAGQSGQAAAKGAILIAAPLKIKQGTGSPIRALALVPKG